MWEQGTRHSIFPKVKNLHQSDAKGISTCRQNSCLWKMWQVPKVSRLIDTIHFHTVPSLQQNWGWHGDFVHPAQGCLIELKVNPDWFVLRCRAWCWLACSLLNILWLFWFLVTLIFSQHYIVILAIPNNLYSTFFFCFLGPLFVKWSLSSSFYFFLCRDKTPYQKQHKGQRPFCPTVQGYSRSRQES